MNMYNPVLIGGSPRSGTTALLQTLNSNPNTFISSEENILNALQGLEKILNTQDKRSRALVKGMRELSPRETLTSENIHSHNFKRESIWPTLKFIYEFHHKQIHPDFQMKLWGDKYPLYWRDINSIVTLRNVRYIHITRNPLDVVNSMLRRTEAAKRGRDWWKSIVDFDEMLETWAEAYLAVLSKDSDPNVKHIHYEELVFGFGKTIEELNNFIGIELEFNDVLVTSQDLHFDRQYIDSQMEQKIKEHKVVQKYIANLIENRNYPHVLDAASILLKT